MVNEIIQDITSHCYCFSFIQGEIGPMGPAGVPGNVSTAYY